LACREPASSCVSTWRSAVSRPVAETRSLLISHFGIFGFADGGRVYVDGDSPGELHFGYGGGIWTSFLGRPNTLSLALANSDEGVQFYAVWGFAF